MIDRAKKDFPTDLLHRANTSFIVTRVKKLYLVDTWVDGKIG